MAGPSRIPRVNLANNSTFTRDMPTSPADPVRLTRIVLGVTGGIAAYKAAELGRMLVKNGV